MDDTKGTNLHTRSIHTCRCTSDKFKYLVRKFVWGVTVMLDFTTKATLVSLVYDSIRLIYQLLYILTFETIVKVD